MKVVKQMKRRHGGLGVSTIFTDGKNWKIIIEHYKKNPELTMKQVTFLCLCWKGKNRERARKYLAMLKDYKKNHKLDDYPEIKPLNENSAMFIEI